MRRPRISIRGWILASAVVALVLRLCVTARDVERSDRGVIWHLWFDPKTGELRSDQHAETNTFWPRYWRAVLSRPWPGSYRCACRPSPPPGWMELAASGESRDVLAVHNRLLSSHLQAMNHRDTLKSLTEGIEFDRKRVADLDAEVRRAAARGVVMNGAEGVRRMLLKGIASGEQNLADHSMMAVRYEREALRPWRSLPFPSAQAGAWEREAARLTSTSKPKP